MILAAPQPMHALLSSLGPGVELIAEDATPDFDLQIPLMSLPHAFGTTLETIPRDVPYLKPDPATYSVIPWLSSPEGRTARLICDIYRPDGSPFQGDPRFILKKTLKKAHDMGYDYNVGPELEFFLFRNGSSTLLPMDRSGYFDLATDESHKVMSEITAAMETFGIEVEASHHEVAPGQHELDFRYGNAIVTADRLLTLRTTVKAVAQRNGLRASFMPKPVMGMAGSGMHVHQSLSSMKTKKNLFYNPKDKYKLSDIAYNFIAGQLQNIKGMMAVLCPTVNSYKRLVPGYEAPVYISWSATNRSALVRGYSIDPLCSGKEEKDGERWEEASLCCVERLPM